MTKEEDNPHHDPCVAALLAVTLVSQVLDEASVIANAAKDSGQPWQYVTSLKKLRSSRYRELYDEDPTFTTVKSNGDSQYYQLNGNIENLSNAIFTSTPQKDSVHTINSKNESNIIGQGDEEFELSNAELKRSTAMIITRLFDMSDVEHANVSDESDIIPINCCDQNDLLIKAMTNIMDSYVDNALNIVFGQEGHGDDYRLKSHYFDSSDHTEGSSYSFLSDSADVCKDMCSNANNEAVGKKSDNEELAEIENENKKINNEVNFYENAYLTLNRDYEQYSEDDEPVLQDPKAIPMQEVELLTANTSSEDIKPCEGKKELVPTEISTSAGGSRKSSLVRRCRLQGARLLSCLGGWWWRRKLLGRRKAPRPGSIRGVCPLSPDARRRAASLLDHRNLRTPSPSTSMVWKFNTVSEALVHSSRWKEYGLKMSLNENDEF